MNLHRLMPSAKHGTSRTKAWRFSILARALSNRQRGAQLIEMALIMPVLMTVVFAIIGYSVVFMVQHSLSSAVSQGARTVAVVGSATTPEIAARQLLQASLPGALYPAGFGFRTRQLTGPTDCGNALGAGNNPSLSCLQFEGTFVLAQNPFLSNIPFASQLFPRQLSSSAVVLYQTSEGI